VHCCPRPSCSRSFIRLEHLKRHIVKDHKSDVAQVELSNLLGNVQKLKDTKEQAALNLKLIEAVCDGNIEALQPLVDEGADVNFEAEGAHGRWNLLLSETGLTSPVIFKLLEQRWATIFQIHYMRPSR